MMRFACVLALVATFSVAGVAAAGGGKPGSSEAAVPAAPTGCISIPSGGPGYAEVRRTPYTWHPTFIAFAYAGWCWNDSTHRITSIQNTVADQKILGHEPCPPPRAPFVYRYSGGVGYTLGKPDRDRR